MTALVVYGEALTRNAALQTSPNIDYIEGRFFLPVLPLVLLLPISSLRAAFDRGETESIG